MDLTAGGIPTTSTNPVACLCCCHPRSSVNTKQGPTVPIPTYTHPCLLFPTQGTLTLSPHSLLCNPRSRAGDWLVGRPRHRAEKGRGGYTR